MNLKDTLNKIRGKVRSELEENLGVGKAGLGDLGASFQRAKQNPKAEAIRQIYNATQPLEKPLDSAYKNFAYPATVGASAIPLGIAGLFNKKINDTYFQNLNESRNQATQAAKVPTKVPLVGGVPYAELFGNVAGDPSSAFGGVEGSLARRATGGAILGAGLGAIQPAQNNQERLLNAGLSGAIGGALPVGSDILSTAGKSVRSVLNPGSVPVEGQLVREAVDLPRESKPKKFLQTVSESQQTTPQGVDVAKSIDPQTYQPITNKQSLQAADDIIRANPDEARNFVLSNTPPTAEKSTTAISLLKKYESEGNFEAMQQVLDSYDKQLRSSGQFIQAASLWDKLSPQSLVRVANREAEKLGKTLPTDFQTDILRRLSEVQKLPEGELRSQATFDVLRDIAKNLPLNAGELFESYRYQNMLSGPRTQERNIYSNLFQTLITRPTQLFFNATTDAVRAPFNRVGRDVYFSDVPKYYKDVFVGLPNAYAAAKEAFKQSDFSKYDLTRGSSVIESLRQENTPQALKVIPQFLESQDKFFSSLISGGEKARLMAKGIDEDAATATASQLAEKYLYRQRLGESTKEDALFVRALDSLGSFALKGRQLPVVGKPYSWFVPFVTTPINAAKFMVESSPAGLVGGKVTSEKVAQSLPGALMMAWGGVMASNDKVTWSAPTDTKQKELFYASGRKPFSVEINGRWVPMTYFGPYALSLALPAAYKQEFENDPKAWTEDTMSKSIQTVADTAKFITSQTPLQGVSSFFRMVDGDQDVSLGSLSGFTASQAIPLDGLVRYVATLTDPVFRKAKGFRESVMKDIPGLSKNLEPYVNPLGEPERRNSSDYIAPYSVGIPDSRFEKPLENRQKVLQSNALINKLEREAKGAKTGSTVGLNNLPDGRIAYQDKNGDIKVVDPSKYDGTYKSYKSLVSDENLPQEIKEALSQNVKPEFIKRSLFEEQKPEFDAAFSLAKDRSKRNDDVNTWLKAAEVEYNFLTEYRSTLDPKEDKLEYLKVTNSIEDIKDQAGKYQKYGGFKKPKVKKPKKLSGSVSASMPKVARPTVKRAKAVTRKSGGLKLGKIRRPKTNLASLASGR